jgi:hypothetical protein
MDFAHESGMVLLLFKTWSSLDYKEGSAQIDLASQPAYTIFRTPEAPRVKVTLFQTPFRLKRNRTQACQAYK